MKKMRKGVQKKVFIFLTVLLVLGVTGLCFHWQVSGSSDKKDNEEIADYLMKIEGIDKIENENFKKQLLKYLTIESTEDIDNIHNGINYEKKYQFLSEEYLNESFPEIENVEEYKEAMKFSESLPVEYLRIIDVKRIEENSYQVDLVYKANAEGNIIKMKERYYFIKEKQDWKYNGKDSEFREYEYLED